MLLHAPEWNLFLEAWIHPCNIVAQSYYWWAHTCCIKTLAPYVFIVRKEDISAVRINNCTTAIKEAIMKIMDNFC